MKIDEQKPSSFSIVLDTRRGGTWINFCWVCAAGFSDPSSIIVYSVATGFIQKLGNKIP